MSITVYTPPKEIKVPKINFSGTREENQSANDKFKADILAWIKEKTGYDEPNTGYILRFQVADGYAEYMVISAKAGLVVHLPLDDAWEYPLQRWTKKGLRDEIEMQKRFRKIFEKPTTPKTN